MSGLPKAIERLVLELGLAFAGVTIGVEIHSCQKIDECQQSLAVIEPSLNNSAPTVFCENPLLRDNYLRLIEEGQDLKLTYENLLHAYCNTIQYPPR